MRLRKRVRHGPPSRRAEPRNEPGRRHRLRQDGWQTRAAVMPSPCERIASPCSLDVSQLDDLSSENGRLDTENQAIRGFLARNGVVSLAFPSPGWHRALPPAQQLARAMRAS